MSYDKFHEAWEDYPDESTPITAAALDHIEEGIQDAADGVDGLDTRVDALEAAPPPVLDHGGLTGLGDDHHSQYHNDARGDARYWPLSTDLATQAEVDLKANDADVVHDAGDETIAGVKTFSSDPLIPDEAYDATAWNGVLEPPTKNAVRDKIEDILDGVTFSGDVLVPDEAYDATNWNGNFEVPTKNAVRDKIESMGGASPGLLVESGAESKVTALTELTAFTGDETFYVVEDDDGTPASRRITVENLAAALAARSEFVAAFAPLANTPQWTLVVDESGASVANWTSVAGTWSADAGGYIKQTDTTDAYRGLRITASVHPGAAMVAQAEVRFPTSAKTLRRAMLAIGSTAAVGSTTDIWAGVQEGAADGTIIQRGDAGTATDSLAIAEDQWYTVRVSQFANVVTVAVDGTIISTYRATPTIATNPVAASWFMLMDYSGETHFRNIKVWRLDGPD